MLFLTKYESNLIVHGFCYPSHYNGVILFEHLPKFLMTKFFLTFMAGQTSMGGVKNIWGSNIYYYITTLSLFRFYRNSQHPENWSVSFKNLFRKCEWISCYLPIPSDLQFQVWKGIFRNSLYVYLSKILTNSRTIFVKDSPTSCLLLVVSQQIIHNTS